MKLIYSLAFVLGFSLLSTQAFAQEQPEEWTLEACIAYAIENNISYMKKVVAGDTLTAQTEELSIGQRIGVYNISITNQDEQQVALFRGTVFRTQDQHFEEISD